MGMVSGASGAWGGGWMTVGPPGGEDGPPGGEDGPPGGEEVRMVLQEVKVVLQEGRR